MERPSRMLETSRSFVVFAAGLDTIQKEFSEVKILVDCDCFRIGQIISTIVMDGLDIKVYTTLSLVGYERHVFEEGNHRMASRCPAPFSSLPTFNNFLDVISCP